MNTNTENYRSFLKEELKRRIDKNARYSVRAFAKSLGLDPRHLAGILKGHKGLSIEKAEDVANRLGCATHSKNFFLESVRAEDGRGRATRNLARVNLERLQENGVLKKLEVELGQVELVSDWIGIAIHEYLKAHPRSTESKITQAFRETKERVQAALNCLHNLKLIDRLPGGKFTAKDVNLFSSDEIPSPVVRNGHRSILKKAEHSLDQDGIHERDFFSLIMNVASGDLPAAKASIRQFLNRFHQQFSKDRTDTEVMSLALQLIPLTKPNSKKNKENDRE